MKAAEYGQHLSHGINSLRGEFFLDYFVFTGIHALHVLIGLAALTIICRRVKGDVSIETPPMLVHEGVATYWHMIDVVWIVLFSLIYLN